MPSFPNNVQFQSYCRSIRDEVDTGSGRADGAALAWLLRVEDLTMTFDMLAHSDAFGTLDKNLAKSLSKSFAW